MQIHELNNFTGTLGSGAYLAIDDGNDTGKISSQGLLAATEARIDNIIAGPAPSAEEIVDARLGDDGVTYPSLGDAIRDQFSDVKSDFNMISDTTKNLWRYPSLGATVNDITYAINSDGSITISGTASAVTRITGALDSTIAHGTQLCLSFESTASLSGIEFILRDVNGSQKMRFVPSGTSGTLTSAQDDRTTADYKSTQIQIASGTTINATIKIQLERGLLKTSYISPITAKDLIARGLITESLNDEKNRAEKAEEVLGTQFSYITQIGINKFNADSPHIISGHYIPNNATSFLDGVNYRLSHPIYVIGGVSYKCTRNRGLATNCAFAYVDEDMNFVSSENGTYDDDYEYYTPTKSGWAVFNLGNVSLDDNSNTMICVASEFPNNFIPFYDSLHPVGVGQILKGKTWLAIGDSLTAVETLGVGVDNYTNYVADKLGLVLTNKGVGGTGYWRGHSTNADFYHRVNALSSGNYDLVTIFGSLNDMGTEDGVTGTSIIGEITDTGFTTICGYINNTLDKVIEKFPDALIGVMTPTKWGSSYNPSFANYHKDYASKIKQICEYRGIPCLDLFNASNLRPNDATFCATYYEEGTTVHPNTLGHKRFSGLVAQFFEGIVYTE